MKSMIKNPVLGGTAVSILTLCGATLMGYAFREAGFRETNIVLLYILSVVITATLSQGFLYGIMTSVAATLAYNYFFTSPFHSLDVDDPGYMVTFVIMTIVSFVTSTLTSKMRENILAATRREEETKELYELTSRLVRCGDLPGVSAVVAECVSHFLKCDAACVCLDEDGYPPETFYQQVGDGRQVQRILGEREKYARRLKTLGETGGIIDEFYEYPIKQEKLLGAIRLPKEQAAAFQENHRSFLDSAAKCTALALSRIHSLQSRIKSLQEIEQERYRGNLLRAISHDLRTPLSGIMGTAEVIVRMSDKEDPRYEMAEGIWKDARWLYSLVENILSLTRLQSGQPVLNKEPQVVEEIVGGALEQMRRRAPECRIEVDVPGEILVVPMDGRLIVQTLVNLLDNAAKHTSAKDEIRITVKKDERNKLVSFTVSDRGDGITEEDMPKIFETFYTSRCRPVDARKGIGLGLSICKTIVEAHGGEITAQNRADGRGAEFKFTLPLEENEQQIQNIAEGE